jgi:hypothetical protein
MGVISAEASSGTSGFDFATPIAFVSVNALSYSWEVTLTRVLFVVEASTAP